jgi:hypothetical protein
MMGTVAPGTTLAHLPLYSTMIASPVADSLSGEEAVHRDGARLGGLFSS